MMKRLQIPALFLFMLVAAFSCTKEIETTDNTQANLELLQGGTWLVNHVDVNYFDYQGNPTSTERFEFGEGTVGGICTFEYTQNMWKMDDNGEIFEGAYTVEDDIINTQGGGTWGIRKVTETDLEMVLRGEAANPCDYSQSGAVYTLTRQDR